MWNEPDAHSTDTGYFSILRRDLDTEETHKLPVKKIPINCNFLFRSKCSPQSIGIGRRRIMKSVMTFKMACILYTRFRLRHLASVTEGSQAALGVC